MRNAVTSVTSVYGNVEAVLLSVYYCINLIFANTYENIYPSITLIFRNEHSVSPFVQQRPLIFKEVFSWGADARGLGIEVGQSHVGRFRQGRALLAAVDDVGRVEASHSTGAAWNRESKFRTLAGRWFISNA